MTTVFTTYKPLCKSAKGIEICRKFSIAPYIDASIRREPDFQCPMPTITGLCRPNLTARSLRKLLANKQDARMIYSTVKEGGGRHLVAILKPKRYFENHEDASKWFQKEFGCLPKNCMTEGNAAVPEEYAVDEDDCRTADAWDESYWARYRNECSLMIVCSVEFIDLWTPPPIPEDIFDRDFPGTHGIAHLHDGEYAKLKALTSRKETVSLYRWEEHDSTFDPFSGTSVDSNKSKYVDSFKNGIYLRAKQVLASRYGTDQFLFLSPRPPVVSTSCRETWKLNVPKSAILERIDGICGWHKVLGQAHDLPKHRTQVFAADGIWRSVFGVGDESDASYIVRTPFKAEWKTQ